MKNAKGEGEVEEKRKRKKKTEKMDGGQSYKQSEGLGGVLWVYKIGIKWPVIAMATTRKPWSLSLSDRQTEEYVSYR